MNEKLLIVSAGKKIEAIHFEKEECAGCTSGCEKLKHSFEISNPRNFEIQKGSVVIVNASKKAQALQGILSLLVPFLCAISGYFLAPLISGIFNKSISDDGRAIFVLLFLAISSAAVFVITRKNPMPGKPEIVEVL